MLQPKKNLRFLLFLGVMIGVSSCHIFRKPSELHKTTNLSNKITVAARQYAGVPYRSGGNDFNGIDCSGLVCNVFKEFGVKMPRISWQQAEFFPPVGKEDIRQGDLVFFITNGGRNINHSGIVTEVRNQNEIIFISASTSRGVVEDNLWSNYWKTKLAKVARPNLKM